MTKPKYQQYFCFIVCILISYEFWFNYQQNIVTILISAAFGGAALIRGEALTRGRRLFQCGYPKVRRLLEGGAYLRPGAYQRKYGNYQNISRGLICVLFIILFSILPFFQHSHIRLNSCCIRIDIYTKIAVMKKSK